MNFGKNPKAWANPTLIEKKKKWRVYHLHEIGIITSDMKYRKEKKNQIFTWIDAIITTTIFNKEVKSQIHKMNETTKQRNERTNDWPTDRPTNRKKDRTNEPANERRNGRTNQRTKEGTDERTSERKKERTKRNNERTNERTKERTNDWPTDRPKEGTDEQTNERKNKRVTERASRCTDGRMKEQAKGHMTTRAPWMHLLTLRTRKGFLTAQRNVWWFYLQKR